MKKLPILLLPLILLSCSDDKIDTPSKDVKFLLCIPANNLTLSCEDSKHTFLNVEDYCTAHFNLPYGHHKMYINADGDQGSTEFEVSATSPTIYKITKDQTLTITLANVDWDEVQYNY